MARTIEDIAAADKQWRHYCYRADRYTDAERIAVAERYRGTSSAIDAAALAVLIRFQRHRVLALTEGFGADHRTTLEAIAALEAIDR